jgi:CBS domain containing-hemolysin-like protein
MVFGSRGGEGTLKEALEEVIQEHEEEGYVLSAEEKEMLRNMLAMGELTVSDVMLPRTDIVAVDSEITLTELKTKISGHGHTRMPVYGEDLDDLRGFIHLKDLVPALAGDEAFDMDKVLRPILFIAPTMKVVDLLVQMRLSGEHMAIVVDEYGGTDGLVTMEDLFEEIVGEIQDEHDVPEPDEELKKLSARAYEADARIRIDVLEEELGVGLREEEDEEDFDTLGGLIFSKLGRVPVRGEIVKLDSIARFDILEADPRRIYKVRIGLLKEGLKQREERIS